MPLPSGFVEVKSSRGIAWVREDLVELGVDALWAEPEPMPGVRSRGGVGTLRLRDDLVAVVRQLRRGGAFGRLLGERYPGPARVRKELEVLVRLRDEGVPVVVPLAALARRPRTFWRLRLLTELLADASPLPSFCAAHPHAHRWAVEAAAVTVRLCFSAGLSHPDLRPDNVLCRLQGDKIRAVLVDLDRASIGAPPDEKKRDAMLVRMARYLHRHGKRLPVRFSRVDHLRFLRGLGLQRQERRREWGRLWDKLRRQLQTRGLAQK